ncbi:MAG: hypothetical protein AAGG06_05290 [Pseudomonadota bacterium]
MFKDDRMISILSGIVVMFAIGVLVQRGDALTNLLGFSDGDLAGNEALGAVQERELVEDVAQVRAGQLVRIDVLANDEGLAENDGEILTIVAQPTCGRGFVQQGSLQYLASIDCSGPQIIKYGIGGSVGQVIAEVTAVEQPPAPALADAMPATDDTARGSVASGLEGPAGSEGDSAVPRPLASAATAPADLVATAPEIQAVDRTTSRPAAPAAIDTRPSALSSEAPVVTDVGRGLDPAIGGLRSAEPGPAPRPAPRLGLALATPSQEDPSTPLPAQRPLLTLAEQQIVDAEVSEPALPQTVPTDLAAAPSLGNDNFGGAAALADRATRPEPPRAPSVGGIESGAVLALARIEPDSPPTNDLIVPRSVAPLPSAPSAAPSLQTSPAASDDSERNEMDGLNRLLARLNALDAPVSPRRSATPSLLGGGSPQAPASPGSVAGLPSAELPCVVPASMEMDVFSGAQTRLRVGSPCHAGTVAELRYAGMALGLRLDRSGEGEIDLLGFQSSTPAALVFEDGEETRFTLSFADVRKVTRVAMVWDADVLLHLHALEFGAREGEAGHISPANARGFEAVRSSGGGYLTTYAPVDGIGQHASVYTHWHRRGGPTGVVKLAIEFASRHREQKPGTCGTGRLAQPLFTILRSDRGQTTRPLISRLGAMACEDIANVSDHLISGAVDDVIVSRR